MYHRSKGRATHFKEFFTALGIVAITGMWVVQCDSDSTSPQAAPAAPALVSPANLAADVADTVTLQWSASSGAASYQVQLSLDSTFASTVLDASDLAATKRAVDGLTGGKTYFWRVRASNAGGMSGWSSRRFSTKAADSTKAQDALTLVSPKGGESYSFTDEIPVKWMVNTDSLNASNIHSYLKQFSTDSGKTWYDMTVKEGSEKTDSNKYEITWIGLDTAQFYEKTQANFTKADFLNRGIKLQVVSYPPHSKYGYSGYIHFHE